MHCNCYNRAVLSGTAGHNRTRMPVARRDSGGLRLDGLNFETGAYTPMDPR